MGLPLASSCCHTFRALGTGMVKRSPKPRTPAQGAEVIVEGAVFLHQDDDVLDVLDGARAIVRGDGQRAADAGREHAQCGRGRGGAQAVAQELAFGVVDHCRSRIGCGAKAVVADAVPPGSLSEWRRRALYGAQCGTGAGGLVRRGLLWAYPDSRACRRHGRHRRRTASRPWRRRPAAWASAGRDERGALDRGQVSCGEEAVAGTATGRWPRSAWRRVETHSNAHVQKSATA